MVADFEEVRDFIVLHYAATARDDTPFWQWCRNIPLPDTLRERIELFKAHGAMREGVDELFRASSWQSVFEGMGIRPHGHCPRVENLEYATIEQTMKNAQGRHRRHGAASADTRAVSPNGVRGRTALSERARGAAGHPSIPLKWGRAVIGLTPFARKWGVSP